MPQESPGTVPLCASGEYGMKHVHLYWALLWSASGSEWKPSFLLKISYVCNRNAIVDKLPTNPSGLKDHEFSFERTLNTLTPHAHTQVCGQKFTLFQQKEAVTTWKRIPVSHSWLQHPIWSLLRLSWFLLLALCLLPQKMVDTRGKTLLFLQGTLQQQLAQQEDTGTDLNAVLHSSGWLAITNIDALKVFLKSSVDIQSFSVWPDLC